jgi:phospholipid transport system substrate-binding protein
MKLILALLAAVILSARSAWCGADPIFTELKAAGSGGEAVSMPLPGAPSQVLPDLSKGDADPAAAAPAQAMLAPDVLVRTMTDEVLRIAQTAPKDEVLATVLPYFNFERMTSAASGKYWKQASEEQQKALVKEFRTLLVKTYSMAIDAAAAGSSVDVQPLGPQANPAEALVKTVVKSKGQTPCAVDYKLEKSEASWRVFDVVIEGVSLVSNYRSQFYGVMGGSGIDGLIKALAAKNSKP